MGQKESGEFEKIPAVRLYKGDRDKLEAFYPKAGYNKVIRKLVRAHLSKLESQFDQRVSAKGLLVNKSEIGEENG